MIIKIINEAGTNIYECDNVFVTKNKIKVINDLIHHTSRNYEVYLYGNVSELNPEKDEATEINIYKNEVCIAKLYLGTRFEVSRPKIYLMENGTTIDKL